MYFVGGDRNSNYSRCGENGPVPHAAEDFLLFKNITAKMIRYG
jgi:hypothetical protein